MVSSSHTSRPSRSRIARVSFVAALALLAACETVQPVLVDSTLATTDAFGSLRRGDIAVLPVEDGTPDGAAQRHLVFLRQEIARQLVDRLFSPIEAAVVDASLRGSPDVAVSESVLAPASWPKLVGHSDEDAVFALRVQRWDESRLPTDKRVRFEFQAAMVARDGALLWGGAIQGEVKAGGLDAAPRDREGMAKSCGTLAVGAMLQRLPRRAP